MDLPSTDPYSYARPDIGKIVHTHLDLFVDFNETVLRGKAILFMDMEYGRELIILDMFKLDINKIHVTDYTYRNVGYEITTNVDVGNKLVIWAPWHYKRRYTQYKYHYREESYEFRYNYKIHIEYETRKNSSALYWLRSDQTSDGTHPMLITNNKFTYARGVFPCQDSPSVRFTYTAEDKSGKYAALGFTPQKSEKIEGVRISVPKDFNFVTICGITCKQIINDGNRCKHIFFETIPMPSYAMIIMVGSLKNMKPTTRDNVTLWAEKKYIEQSKTMFANIIKMLTIAEALCGSRLKDEYNVCVLPPNIPEIELQCLSMIFVSSMLLNEDLFTICSTVAQKVAQSWAGGIVTCENLQHLWLNKSFSTFISREIIYRIYNKHLFHYEISFLERKTISDMNKKTCLRGTNSLRLVPNLWGILPKDITKYVPDEMGYLLLKCLQNSLGGPKIFESYLKHYIHTHRFKSINTDDWMNHLRYYFVDKLEEVNSILDKWLCGLCVRDIYNIYPHMDYPVESQCCLLAEQWSKTTKFSKSLPLLTKLNLYNNLEKREFLTYLYASSTVLPVEKLKWLYRALPLHEQACENRFLLLRLYIKSKWSEMTQPALEFVREYCTPTFAYPILHDLYELDEETRQQAILWFKIIVKQKLLLQTIKEIASILNVELV